MFKTLKWISSCYQKQKSWTNERDKTERDKNERDKNERDKKYLLKTCDAVSLTTYT